MSPTQQIQSLKTQNQHLREKNAELQKDMNRMIAYFKQYPHNAWYVAYLQESNMRLGELCNERELQFQAVNQALVALREKHKYMHVKEL